MAVGLGFDALDVREDDLLLSKGELGAVSWIASHDLLQMVAEDLRAQPCRYLTLCHFGFGIVHDGNRTVSTEDLQRGAELPFHRVVARRARPRSPMSNRDATLVTLRRSESQVSGDATETALPWGIVLQARAALGLESRIAAGDNCRRREELTDDEFPTATER